MGKLRITASTALLAALAIAIAAAVQRFARLFMIPTMYHCNGGYGPSQFDTVGSIVDWVELGTAPDDHVKWLGRDLLRPGGWRR